MLHAHNHCQNILHTPTWRHRHKVTVLLQEWGSQTTPKQPSASYTVTNTCHAMWQMVTPSDGERSCKSMSPPYPLSPTRCWRYRFSYLDSDADCGLGRCKRPAEARCLPPCQSPHLGSRKWNPLWDSHTNTPPMKHNRTKAWKRRDGR